MCWCSLAVAEAIRAIVAGLKDNLKKQPTESLLFEHYSKLVLVVDEVVDEVCTVRLGADL